VAFDLVIDIENRPGALAEVAKAISDAGVNIAAATCVGSGDRAELHILVPHAEAARHALAISHLAVTREREVVVVDVEDRPGVLASVFDVLRDANVNVQETENIVFTGAESAVARINLDGAPGDDFVRRVRAANDDILDIQVVPLTAPAASYQLARSLSTW
jgi:hypothetical protein